MRSATLKWMMLILTLLVGAILLVQLYWLNQIYNFEQKEFNTNVVKSMRGLCEDMEINDRPGTQLQKLIEHPNANTFILQIDTIPQKDSLVFFLVNEFDDFNVFTDCKLAVYNDSTQRYQYDAYLPTAASNQPQPQNYSQNASMELPLYKRNYPYIHFFFPHRQQYIIHQLNLWILTSILLLLALIGFAASMFYFYRQKFLNELQKDFVNNFTHEFKTPLAVMKLANGVLNSPSIQNQPERLKKYTAIMADQTEHLHTQVEKLLKTASTEKHELPLDKSSFRPNDMVDSALLSLEPLIKQTNTRIDFIRDLTQSSILADRSHLQMVIVNLVENAIKYSKEPYVIITLLRENGHFIFSIKDNGIGFEKKYSKKIFKKFFRIPTGDVHNVKGFGLGLNFVKKVIDAHNGRIQVSSVPGVGTEFRIILPLS
jgi:two-component system, OmpR family, phosphate regulon sensor histidine kinase PhoR